MVKLKPKKKAIENLQKEYMRLDQKKYLLKKETQNSQFDQDQLTLKLMVLEQEKEKLENIVKTIKGRGPLNELEGKFKRLHGIESDIARMQELAMLDQEKHADYERNIVETGKKIQERIRASEEKEMTLKQLRETVNKLKTANPEQKEQIEAHRKKLADDVRNQKNKCIQLKTELCMLQDEKSKLKLETNLNEHQFPFAVIDIFPMYLQIKEEIGVLKTIKFELKAEIGQRVFELISKKN